MSHSIPGIIKEVNMKIVITIILISFALIGAGLALLGIVRLALKRSYLVRQAERAGAKAGSGRHPVHTKDDSPDPPSAA